MRCLNFWNNKTVKSQKKFWYRKLQKTWLVTLFGPLAAILNFAQKCKQTAVSQKLSKIKKFSRYFLKLMRCLNCWDNKNFWGGKFGPLTHASAVNRLSIQMRHYFEFQIVQLTHKCRNSPPQKYEPRPKILLVRLLYK